MGSSVRGAIDLALRADRPGRAARRAGPRPRDTAPRRRLRRALRPHPHGRRRGPHARVGDRRAAGPAVARRRRRSPTEPPDAEGKAEGPSGSSPPGFQPRAATRSGAGAAHAQPPAARASSTRRSTRSRPEVGELDAEAFDAAVAQDPEAAAAMLADMAVATDVALRAAARRLAGRVFLQLGRVGPRQGAGHPAARAVPRAGGGPRPGPHARRVDAERVAAARQPTTSSRAAGPRTGGRCASSWTSRARCRASRWRWPRWRRRA